jgi:hypothetical protein
VIIPGLARSKGRGGNRVLSAPKHEWEPTFPKAPSDLIGRKKRDMTAEERRRWWAAFDLEEPPLGYDDWFLVGSHRNGFLAAFPVVGFMDESDG